MYIVASIKNKDEKFVGKNHVIQEPTVMHFNFHKKNYILPCLYLD